MMNTYNHDMVAECIAQWGNADSIALLDPQSLIFSVPHMQGIIGYRTQVGCAVVLADPVCPADTLSSLTMAFHDYCKEHFKTVMYALASERFAQWALHSTCKSALSIGHELIIDPRNDIKAGNGSSVRRLRNKYNHALRSGIIINEYVGNDTNIEQAMEQLREVWLQNRQGMQVSHSAIDLFSHRANKRWFYAEWQGKIVALLMLNRLTMHNGWVLNRLLLSPDTPYGTSELLILSVLDTLREEGCSFFSIGTVPSQGIEQMHGFGFFSRLFMRSAFKIASKLLTLQGRQTFWNKFQPRKSNSFLVFDKSYLGLREIFGMMRTFNTGRNT